MLYQALLAITAVLIVIAFVLNYSPSFDVNSFGNDILMPFAVYYGPN